MHAVFAGEDIVLSDDEDGIDDKPHYMTVNGKQVGRIGVWGFGLF